MSTFPMPISEEIWAKKYQLKDADGTPIDKTVEDTWDRVAEALASVEAKYFPDAMAFNERESTLLGIQTSFYEALKDWRFTPAGRIVAGAGTDRTVTLFNCYVMGTIPDSLDGIFEMLKEAALTMKQGGGIGYDFSTLRPDGAIVKGVAAESSGPLSFMDVWDAMCKTLMSAGGRRGAMMATMRCDHPDIVKFIEAKRDPGRLRHFNLSVLVTDAFMDAVQKDEMWELKWEGEVWSSMPAITLWEMILEATYAYAEPGVIFIDRINAANNLRYCETIAATNPCGEQPLPPYGACLLGSLNLARLVQNPFTVEASISHKELAKLTTTAVRMLDNVVDISNYPLPQQEEEAYLKRRIGLGVTGVADALLMLGLTYGTEEAATALDEWLKTIAVSAYWASVNLAKEKGAFPAFDADKFLEEGTFASKLPSALKSAIRNHGIRNSHLLSIAPTGTISLYSGNVSSGIEPIFAAEYSRNVTQNDGSRKSQKVRDYAIHLWQKTVGYDEGIELPPGFVSAQDLKPEAHILMQATAQKWIDSSISKTINVPEDIDFEDFKNVYELAYATGCKGCTTYRPNDVTGSILSVEPTKPEPAPVEDKLMSRPEALDGTTYKVKMGGQDHALYVTITDVEGPDGHYRPFEIFLNTKDPTHYQWSIALTRMISAVFRRGGDVSFVAEELKAVFDPTGGAFHGGKYVPSLIAAVGDVIETHMRAMGYLDEEAEEPELPLNDPGEDWMAREGRLAQYGDDEEREVLIHLDIDGKVTAVDAGPAKRFCPKCLSSNLKKESGCLTCLDCGHSKCG